MHAFQWLWLVCFFAGYLMIPVGLGMSYFTFKELEKVYPEVFNLQRYSLFGVNKKVVRYWTYILVGKYKSFNRSDLRMRCVILRWFLVMYSIVVIIVCVGLFI